MTGGPAGAEEPRRTLNFNAGWRLHVGDVPGAHEPAFDDAAWTPVTLSFEISGPVEWRGGIAQGPDNFVLARALPVEGGVNRVLIRSRPEAGPIVVAARAEGLRPARLEITSVPFDATDGWSTLLPGDGLPSHLGRGPTPTGPSFVATRQSVAIVDVRAGSHPETAAQAFDDDEVTAWTSAGAPGAAWIEFSLERPAELVDASFKMEGWQERSYPIRIVVDGQEAYRGVTARSFGYITIPLRARGRTVRVELVDQVAAGNSLGIVEAEFHEPAPGGPQGPP